MNEKYTRVLQNIIPVNHLYLKIISYINLSELTHFCWISGFHNGCKRNVYNRFVSRVLTYIFSINVLTTNDGSHPYYRQCLILSYNYADIQTTATMI